MKRLSGLGWFLLVTISLSSTQALSDRAAADFKIDTRTAVLKNEKPLLPDNRTLQLLSFNQQPLLADLLWLQTIQYFGSGNPYAMFPALGPMVDQITQLDPKYAYPYEFGLVVLPFMHQANLAEKIGLRSREALPNNGLLTYYLATVYHLNLLDYKKAADYYDLAATLPGTPTAAASLAKVARDQVAESIEDRDAAKIFWATAAQNARNDDEYIRSLNWLAHIEIVQSIEIAAKQFQLENGHFPTSLEELAASGKIQKGIRSPIHRKLILEPNGRVNFDELEDSLL